MAKSSKISTLDWESYEEDKILRTSLLKKKGKHRRAKTGSDIERLCRRT